VISGVDGAVGETADAHTSKWAFFIGSGGGAHIFFHDVFSLDFALIPGLGLGKGKNENDQSDWDYDNIYFDFNISIGASGWL
jgi:hypothetical protein